jgi:hypothetical protein
MKNWKLLGDAPKRNPHDENYLEYQDTETKEIIYIKENQDGNTKSQSEIIETTTSDVKRVIR